MSLENLWKLVENSRKFESIPNFQKKHREILAVLWVEFAQIGLNLPTIIFRKFLLG